ncbi:MAG: hypothetical protein AAF356_13015 [Planctomycetota bacterium]
MRARMVKAAVWGGALMLSAGAALAQTGNRQTQPDGRTGAGAATYRVEGNATYGNGPFDPWASNHSRGGSGVYWHLGGGAWPGYWVGGQYVTYGSGWAYGFDGTHARRGSIAYPGWPLNRRFGYGFGGGFGWSPWNYRYPYAYRVTPTQYWGPLDGRYSGGWATTAGAGEALPEPTARELADGALAAGAFGAAAGLYRDLLEAGGDEALAAGEVGEVMRLLGVALLGSDERDERLDGISVVRLAHEQYPELAREAVPMWVFGGSVSRVRGVLRDVVAEGHRAGGEAESASAWLSAAVLMQAEGRDAVALKMLDRASAGGFAGEGEAALRRALSPRP